MFNNVITHDDDMQEDVVRIQRRLLNRAIKGLPGLRVSTSRLGVWDNTLTHAVYDVCMKSNIESQLGCSKFDILGYVDKDAEHLLGEDPETDVIKLGE